tara:strand:- start:19 stop:561 length:543 start_codon:yes stop_codon:yes gene_type:complete
MYKAMNVLNYWTNITHLIAKAALFDVWQVETKSGADKIFDLSMKIHEPICCKAAFFLVKNRNGLTSLFSFKTLPLQIDGTDNFIEPVFSAIRYLTKLSKRCLLRNGLLSLNLKFWQCAVQNDGYIYPVKMDVDGKFKDQIEIELNGQKASNNSFDHNSKFQQYYYNIRTGNRCLQSVDSR